MNKATASTVYQNLAQAYERVRDPSTRSTDHHAINEEGLQVSPLAASAVQFCSIGTLIRQLNGVVNVGSYKTTKLVNAVLRSDEFECLLEAANAAGFDSVADFHEHAKSDERKFHEVWTTALFLGKQLEAA